MPALPTKPLGKNGPQVTQVGFGLMGLSAFYGKPLTDEERFKVLDKAYESGEMFWDTADMYGDSEDLLGKWFARNPGKRDNIFLATKFANQLLPEGGYCVKNDPEYVKEACAKSLKRLGLPYVDLYYCHRFNGEVPVEATVGAMAELVKEGKVKYLGLSECSSDTLRRAHKVHPITAVQMEYSPFAMEIEAEQTGLLKTCRELGVAIVAYSPIGRGMITGSFRSPDDFGEGDFRKFLPRFSKENFPKNLQLVDKIKAIADGKGCTPTQLTLAWLMAQGDDIFPIPGTTKISRLEENLGSLKVKLTRDEERTIRQAVEAAEVHGSRYPEAAMKYSFADTPPLKV